MFALIQQYKLWLLGLAVATLMSLSAAGAWQYQANAYGKQIADIRTAQAEALATAQAQARAEEQRRQLAVEGIRADAHEKINQAASDAAAADAHAVGLQQQVDKLARRPSRCPGTTNGSEAADPAKLLLADLLNRADGIAGRMAAYADRARIAGEACELSYGAVRSAR